MNLIKLNCYKARTTHSWHCPLTRYGTRKILGLKRISRKLFGLYGSKTFVHFQCSITVCVLSYFSYETCSRGVTPAGMLTKIILESLLEPPPPRTHTLTIMDMPNNKRHNVLSQARVNFSQSETSSLLRGGGGGKEVNNRKDLYFMSNDFIILQYIIYCIFSRNENNLQDDSK